MKIQTTRFGTLSINKEDTIYMPFGIPGFPHEQQFVIIQHKEDSPFLWYQSSQEPALAFVITDPWLFVPDFNFNRSKALKDLGWDPGMEQSQLQVYVIVNIPQGSPNKMTANLMGPILINKSNREAVQIIIPESAYSHKHPLIETG